MKWRVMGKCNTCDYEWGNGLEGHVLYELDKIKDDCPELYERCVKLMKDNDGTVELD